MGVHLVELLGMLCFKGRTKKDAALQRDWLRKNKHALWTTAYFRATQKSPQEQICKGTASGLFIGAALNTMFAFCLLQGAAQKAGVSLEWLLLQGDDVVASLLSGEPRS